MPKRRKRDSFISAALLDNPVLVQAVGLTPAIIATTSLRVALWVALITAIHIIICEVVASAFLKKLQDWARIAVYFTIGILIVFGAGMLFEVQRDALDLTTLRLILPLLAANAMVAIRCERFAVYNGVKDGLRDAIANAVGFAAVIILMGFLRESLGHGSLMGWEFSTVMRVRGFWMPFGGFLLLGFLAAVLKSLLHHMSARGKLPVDAEEAMELAPEDRLERLEKIHRLLQEAEKYNEDYRSKKEAMEALQEEEQDDGAPREEIASKYTQEDKARINRDLEELLKEFQGGKRDE
jgi:electron transport complex protein RnfE